MTVVTTVLIVGGCGGGGEEAHVTAREFANCIGDQSVLTWSRNEDDLDLIAADAGDGGIYVDFGENTANVAVERTNSDADRTEEAYKTFGKAFETNLSDLLHRRGNVVWVYDKSPTESETSAVETCID
jgi:hypothetical protein